MLHCFSFLLCTIVIFGHTCIAQEDDAVPRSPKHGWGEFEVVEEEGPPSTTLQILYWLPNRIADAIDIFRVDVGAGPAIGAVGRISKWGQFGYRQMMPTSIRLGVFGREAPYLVESSNEFGLGPFYEESKDREVCPGEVGIGADLFLGAYMGICVEEVFDFVGGIFTLDMREDDWLP